VIELGMRSAKKKPLTKKEREEKKAQGETLEEVAANVTLSQYALSLILHQTIDIQQTCALETLNTKCMERL
jgi:hypothetical protein